MDMGKGTGTLSEQVNRMGIISQGLLPYCLGNKMKSLSYPNGPFILVAVAPTSHPRQASNKCLLDK